MAFLKSAQVGRNINSMDKRTLETDAEHEPALRRGQFTLRQLLAVVYGLSLPLAIWYWFQGFGNDLYSFGKWLLFWVILPGPIIVGVFMLLQIPFMLFVSRLYRSESDQDE